MYIDLLLRNGLTEVGKPLGQTLQRRQGCLGGRDTVQARLIAVHGSRGDGLLLNCTLDDFVVCPEGTVVACLLDAREHVFLSPRHLLALFARQVVLTFYIKDQGSRLEILPLGFHREVSHLRIFVVEAVVQVEVECHGEDGGAAQLTLAEA